MATEIISYSEAEAAQYIARTGRKVIECDGIHFCEAYAGFFRPVNLHRPYNHVVGRVPGTLGHKMAVADPSVANGFVNVMVADELTTYSMDRLSRDRRKALKRGLKKVEVRVLPDPLILLEQGGHEVDTSFHHRTGWGPLLTPEAYRARIARIMANPAMVWFGGYVDGKLGGYICLSVIERYGGMGTIATHTDFLPTRINDVLLYEMCRRCQEAGCVDNLSFGMHSNKPSLNQFKETMLFKHQALPAYVRLQWPVGMALRLLWPQKYRRVYGYAATAEQLPPVTIRTDETAG